MQLLRGTLWEIHPTGTNTGAGAGPGSFADYFILLQLHGDKKTATLAEHSDPQQDYPKFRWLSDDTLMIDIGKVSWVRSQVHKAGSVKITYAYSIGE